MLYFRFTAPRWNCATAFRGSEDLGKEIGSRKRSFMVEVSLTGSFNFAAANDPDFRISGVLRRDQKAGIKRRGPQMTIEIIAFLGFVGTLTSLIAKAYERRQDVLYGPYIQGRNPQRPFQEAIARLAQAIKTSGLRRHFADIGWKFRGVSCLASAIIC